MSDQPLSGRTIALLVADGFNETDFIAIRDGLEIAGASTMVVSPTAGPIGRVLGRVGHDLGEGIPVDVPIESVTESDYDAVILPGGGESADAIRADPSSQQFIQHFLSEARPVGLVAEALRVAIAFNMAGGRRVAATSELASDLDAAGIAWADEPVVADKHLISCRRGADIPVFLEEFIKEVCSTPLRPDPVTKVTQGAFARVTKGTPGTPRSSS